jgi:hypothetical protein
MGVLVIFNIALSPEMIDVIGQGLDELKFKVAAPVAQAIQAQINVQLAALNAQAAQAAQPQSQQAEPTAAAEPIAEAAAEETAAKA